MTQKYFYKWLIPRASLEVVIARPANYCHCKASKLLSLRGSLRRLRQSILPDKIATSQAPRNDSKKLAPRHDSKKLALRHDSKKHSSQTLQVKLCSFLSMTQKYFYGCIFCWIGKSILGHATRRAGGTWISSERHICIAKRFDSLVIIASLISNRNGGVIIRPQS